VDAGVFGRGLDSIIDLNALPFAVREQLYFRLVPEELLTRFAIDRQTLRDAGGEHQVRITAPDEASWARVELRAAGVADPVLLVIVGMAFDVPELSFVQINDPGAPRYGIDRDEEGGDTLLGTVGRNLVEERRALAAGLAPGQVRRGLRMLGAVLARMDDFTRLLGREFYLVEPLFYHSAILYERHGCDYFLGRDLMEEIHAGFLPGGALHRRLDGSSGFRASALAASVRGRSWALHDGVLTAAPPPGGEARGDGWAGVKMFRVPGRPVTAGTFPGGAY
jgi:hypothetical protein